MAKASSKNGRSSRYSASTKYDAHHTVLSKTYGALADLRRELAEPKSRVSEREELLKLFADAADSQRAWLLLEDYFERLSLSRKDFGGQDWWPRIMAARGRDRVEEVAMLFLRAQRSLPTELQPFANAARFAEIEEAEAEHRYLSLLENWMFPPSPTHLDSPRASLKVLCEVQPLADQNALHSLQVRLNLFRPRTGEKLRSVAELIELQTRAAHEQELFPPCDWEFIQWLTALYKEDGAPERETLSLTGVELLRWLCRWGADGRLELGGKPLQFEGQVIQLVPRLVEGAEGLEFTHGITLPGGQQRELKEARFFAGEPSLALVDHVVYVVRNAPPARLVQLWAERPVVPVRKLSTRFRTHLRKTQAGGGADWDSLCVTHSAVPQFVFELLDDTVRLRLLARSDRNKSVWHWTGQDWQADVPHASTGDKAEVLEDPRLELAVGWLRRLDWFTPEPGLWIGDANENFLGVLASVWPQRPQEAEYLGNQAFQRLFLAPRQLRPTIMVKGTGIDWFTVSAEWEQEGMKLTPADLQRLQTATGRFVKLPDAGWVELDIKAVSQAHEAMADLGLETLSALPQKVGMDQAAHLDEEALKRFGDSAEAKSLRKRLADFEGIPEVQIPARVEAELRPYQKEGFSFLCHLTAVGLGGILADDMGLGKTLQTLTWLTWLHARAGKTRKPALVICPASVLHNWRRESNRFAPHLRVLVLESGSARHNLRKQIPQHDLIVTNYAILRRDLEALQKFSFGALILDEAQFIKNPTAQVTQSVKQLKADQRLALTGTPLENRLLDLWSITDFIQPGYLGTQEQFTQTYDVRGEGEEGEAAQRIARKRLSSKLRPLMLRRLKRQVAKDLPERIEVRRDCELGEEQRKLYLAELRRSRDQIMQAVAEKGLMKSKIHVLAALTRLRQICCHPRLVGSDTASGKTETLMELLEPLLEEGQKVLVFSQFVQMLKLMEAECVAKSIPTHILTGESKERQAIVQEFQNDTRPGVFLLSLRAAGTGLNLTTASYVILYDPWWNPAVEAQAIDRSHRIGQTRTVHAYRLIAPGTVEEKIWELQQRKAQTISDVLGEEGFARSLSKDDLEYLFSED
ncbi:MAG TPA: serine/threonine protein phosphatase [Verrucomicrobiales bacterium]|nr:serine/threonine protein phosphatase [Verrucomicrobiales bacterium]